MAFTYTGDLTQPLQYLRFKLDDKEEDFAEYQDQELNYFINKISGTPTENDLNKIALRLLKQQLQEIMRGPSRERSGAFEVYGPTSESLKLAISELEDEIRLASPVKPFFGGVKKADIQRNREDESIVQGKFYDGVIYRNSNEFPEDDFDGIL